MLYKNQLKRKEEEPSLYKINITKRNKSERIQIWMSIEVYNKYDVHTKDSVTNFK